VNGAFTALKCWLNAGLGFLYPECCQLCGLRRATPEEGFVCERCYSSASFIHPPFCDRCGLPFQGAITNDFECTNCRELEFDFCSARAAVEETGKVRDAILRYKYNRALWFEPFLAELLLSRAVPELVKEKWDGIVPIPLHPRKRREREFNQAERLAIWLGEATGLPVNSGLLRRVVHTPTQTKLSRLERLANVRKAFALQPKARADGQRLVLLDDVFTTGATASACAGILRQAGAAEVCVWTVARGI
jgi:competence protein ComFC